MAAQVAAFKVALYNTYRSLKRGGNEEETKRTKRKRGMEATSSQFSWIRRTYRSK